MYLFADAFLQAHTRFISRRDNPQSIHGDHGENFVVSDIIMREGISLRADARVQQYSNANHTQWHFITPGASNEGVEKVGSFS